MRYLPELERELLEAATRQETQHGASTNRRSRTHRWGRAPLLAGAAALLMAGAAVAAATGALDTGDPVPKRADTFLRLLRPLGDDRFLLSDVHVADPDGGPDWGMGTYDAKYLLADKEPKERRPLTCVVVGRVQDGQLGVVGRDGVFGNDGRFHPLSPSSPVGGGCGGHGADGEFMSVSSGSAIPASGYTGWPGTAIGGCRTPGDNGYAGTDPAQMHVDKLRDVSPCDPDGLRYVVAGFAGRNAASATLTSQGRKLTQDLDASHDGPYLFVVRGNAPQPSLSFTFPDGTTCQMIPMQAPCRGLLEP